MPRRSSRQTHSPAELTRGVTEKGCLTGVRDGNGDPEQAADEGGEGESPMEPADAVAAGVLARAV